MFYSSTGNKALLAASCLCTWHQ